MNEDRFKDPARDRDQHGESRDTRSSPARRQRLTQEQLRGQRDPLGTILGSRVLDVRTFQFAQINPFPWPKGRSLSRRLDPGNRPPRLAAVMLTAPQLMRDHHLQSDERQADREIETDRNEARATTHAL